MRVIARNIVTLIVVFNLLNTIAVADDSDNATAIIERVSSNCEKGISISQYKEGDDGQPLWVFPWPPERTLELANEGCIQPIIVIARCMWRGASATKDEWDIAGPRSVSNEEMNDWLYAQSATRDKAVLWYKKAIKLGDDGAMLELANKYVERYRRDTDLYFSDKASAVSLFKQAAENGRIEAIQFLWKAYQEGVFVLQDYSEAYKYLIQGAEAGDKSSQYNLGILLSDKKRFSADLVAAYKWFLIANYSGWLNENKDQIQVLMTPEEILEGQALAREWLESRPATNFGDWEQIKPCKSIGQ